MITTEERNRAGGLEYAIDFKEQRIKRLKEISDLSKSTAWLAQAKEIELSIEACKNQIESLADGSVNIVDGSSREIEIARLGGQLKSYRGVISNVQFAERKIDQLNDEIGKHRAELKVLRDKTGNNVSADNKKSRGVI